MEIKEGRGAIPEFKMSKKLLGMIIRNEFKELVESTSSIVPSLSYNIADYLQLRRGGKKALSKNNAFLPIIIEFLEEKTGMGKENLAFYDLLYKETVMHIGEGIDYPWGRLVFEDGKIIQYCNPDYDPCANIWNDEGWKEF